MRPCAESFAVSNPQDNRILPTGRLIPPDLDEAMVAAVVDSFYARARLDPVIGPVFNRVIAPEAWPAHLKTIADFWSSMLLGSGRYSGRPMPKHIAIPDLTDAHFARWLALFRETAEELCPPGPAALFVERAEVIGNNFRLRIAQFRGEDLSEFKPMRAAQRESWRPE
jgi:hemoglobin